MVKAVLEIKSCNLPNQAKLELLYAALTMLIQRGLANADDIRLMKAVLDRLPQHQNSLGRAA